MRYSILQKYIPVFSSILLIGFFLPSILFAQNNAALDNLSAGNTTIAELEAILQKPSPRIEIPGVTFSDPKIIEEEEGTFVYIPFLGEYISSLYEFSIIALSIFAVLGIIFGGITWMLGGEGVNKGKQIIQRSLLALAFGVSLYTLLFTINPNLVQFQHLRVPFIQGETLDGSVLFGEYDSISADLNENNLASQGYKPYDPSLQPDINVPFYSQCGGPWRDKTYGVFDGNGKKATVCQIGCGMTSMAMMISYYTELGVTQPQPIKGKINTIPAPPSAVGKEKNFPLDFNKWIQDYKVKNNNKNGTSGNTLSKFAKAYGLNYRTMRRKDFEKANEFLLSGQPLMVYVQNDFRNDPIEKNKGSAERKTTCKYTKSGHYMVVTGYDPETGTYFTNDPARRNRTGRKQIHKSIFIPKGDFPLFNQSNGEKGLGCNAQFIYVSPNPF